MNNSIVYLIDDVNYDGGAHSATYSQIEYLSSLERYQNKIAIASYSRPNEALRNRLRNVDFVLLGDADLQLRQKLFSAPIKKVLGTSEFSLSEKIIKVKMSIDSRRVGYDKTFQKHVLRKAEIMDAINRYDVVCVPFENSFFRPFAADSACAKKIQWIHTDYFVWKNTNEATRNRSKNDRQLYNGFDQIVFVSEASRNGFIMLYPELRERCAVCYNLMDAEGIREKAAHKPAPETPGNKRTDIVTVARLEDCHKAIKRALHVAWRLRKDGYSFRWTFIGDGVDKDELHAYAKKKKLDDCVVWAGQLENPFPEVKKADLFALFSYCEGIPNTIFESLIIGTPAAATSVSGIPEQIDEKTGWLAENDEDAVYQTMKRILDDPAELKKKRKALEGYVYENSAIQEKVKQIFDMSEGPVADVTEDVVRVSVIVPVYNVEKYLENCLDSLVAQTLDNIEIIVVNDGSPDNSQIIIEKYEQMYPGLVRGVIKENGGLGDARNYGLQYARGYYVVFVDADDWVAPDMLEKLYGKGADGNYDIVLCDIYGVDDATRRKVVERAPFGKEGKLDKRAAVLHSTRPVAISACTKLFKKSIFERFQFPPGWYEDMGVMTTIFSYTDNIYYLPEPLYYYRWGRAGSIQSRKASPRTLEIFQAKQRILVTCNPQFRKEAAFAIYEHCCRFYQSFPQYRSHVRMFLGQNRAAFENNEYIERFAQSNHCPDLLEAPKIPKVIHYCWFGGEKSGLVTDCIASWKKYLPDFEMKEWNETNCDMTANRYVREACAQKNWAYVSDYFRFKALYEEGGIYLDTDVRLYGSLDHLLYTNCFFAFETYLHVNVATAGTAPKQRIIKEVLESYETGESSEYDSHKVYAVSHRITDALLRYGLKQNAAFQILKDNIAVYPPNQLTINVSDGECVAEHLYDASWLGAQNQAGGAPASYRYEVLKHYFLNLKNVIPGGIAENGLDASEINSVIRRYGRKRVLKALIKETLKKSKEK